MSEFTVCQDCYTSLQGDHERLETGRCEDCQNQHQRETYDPMFDDRMWDYLKEAF
jgi:hypothetical protein